MKPPLHLQEINKAREWYNPLRGLSVQRAAQLLEQGERGRYADLQKLYRMAEKRFPVLRALKRRILGGLVELDWSVKIVAEIPEGFTQAQAEAQQKLLRSRYDAIENLTKAIEHLALAEFRGYSHLEPRYPDNDPSRPANRLNPVPQWHWFRDNQTWTWRYDPEARDQEAGSTEIDEADFIIREVDDPINEIALLCFIRANDSIKNWDAFRDDYAIPMLFAILGENAPEGKVKEWLELMEKVTKNSRGALPPGSSVESPDVGNLDGKQFQQHIAFMREEVVLAGTSGLLTMLTAPGSGTLAGSAHQEAIDLIISALAGQVAGTLQAQFDKRVLAEEFPSQPVLAYFSLASEEPEDLNAAAERLAKLKTAGFQADADEVSEKFGLTLTAAATPAPIDPNVDPGSADPLKNRATEVAAAGKQARFEANTVHDVAAADLVTLQPIIDLVAPVRAEMARVAQLDDAGFAAGMAALQPRLHEVQAKLPALEKQILTDHPELENAITDAIGTAFVSGIAEAALARSGKPA